MSPDRPLTDQLRSGKDEVDLWPDHGPRSIHAHLTRPIIQRLVEAEAHTVLDLGCGNGWFSGALDQCGFDVTGLDVNTEHLREARQKYPGIVFEQRDATEPIVRPPPAAFDAVVAIDVIDHVSRPRELLNTAVSLLRPGGVLVVSAPFHGYAKNLALALTGRFDARWEALAIGGRVKFFSRATLLQLLAGIELRGCRFDTVGRIPMFARAMVVSGCVPG